MVLRAVDSCILRVVRRGDRMAWTSMAGKMGFLLLWKA